MLPREEQIARGQYFLYEISNLGNLGYYVLVMQKTAQVALRSVIVDYTNNHGLTLKNQSKKHE